MRENREIENKGGGKFVPDFSWLEGLINAQYITGDCLVKA